jgi:hypothetical protein
MKWSGEDAHIAIRAVGARQAEARHAILPSHAVVTNANLGASYLDVARVRA